MDAASDLHPPISACRFDVPVQLSRKLRPIRCPIVPSSVRVSQKFSYPNGCRFESSPLLSLLWHLSSALLHAQVSPCSSLSSLRQNSCPSGCRFSNRLLPECSDMPQQRSLTFRSPVLPALVCASQNFRAKWMPLRNCNLHFPMRCFGLLAPPF